MKSGDAVFEHELEIFRREAEAAIQFLYAYLTIHRVAADDRRVHSLLNQAPLFWNTNLGALQTAAFMALGRIFDQRSHHNVDNLVRVAQSNPNLFSKTELARRNQGPEPVPPEGLDDYLRNVYQPTPQDFRRLRSYIANYESSYRDIRHKIFAHNDVSTQDETYALFKKTKIKELQRLCVSLASLYDALWHLYYNGRKPILRPRRFSIERMRDKPLPKGWSRTVQEHIVGEIEEFLVKASRLFEPNLKNVQRAAQLTRPNGGLVADLVVEPVEKPLSGHFQRFGGGLRYHLALLCRQKWIVTHFTRSLFLHSEIDFLRSVFLQTRGEEYR